MSEGDPAVGLGHAMADIITLKMREREMKQTILDQAQRIKDHEVVFAETTGRLKKRISELEEAQVGQQVADQKVAYANTQIVRAEENDRISRVGWQASRQAIQEAVAALEKGSPEAALGILKKSL